MKRLLALLLIPIWLFLVSLQFKYPADITSVYDGDTVTATMDLGLGVYKVEKLRLYGINAPEMRGPDKAFGKISRDALRTKILGKKVQVFTMRDKRGKYGRLLAIIHVDGINVNKWMIDKGYAVAKDY